MANKKPKVVFDVIIYQDYIEQYLMPEDRAAHALMYYVLNAGSIIGFESTKLHARSLYKTTMVIYGVSGEAMQKHWPVVDKILLAENLPAMTDSSIRNGGAIIHEAKTYDDGTDYDKDEWQPKGYIKGVKL